jgi:serine protease Do
LLLVTTLMVGVLVGIAIDRRDRPVAAQAQAQQTAGVTRTGADASRPPVAQVPQARAVGDEAVYQELTKQYDQFQVIDKTFELVAKAVSPAVVHIVARKAGHVRDEEATASYFEETGSGVIVRPEHGRGLYVLTNNHVIDGATTADIHIVLQDGRDLHPQRTWSDLKADIAVLRLNRDDLPAARLGDSDDARVGSWVLALGSPFGLTHSVSHGIISARSRHEEELQDDGVENQDFLQTDAAINPGNSGGPLVNLKGEVIGINTAIASNGGGSEGVGFSIPINLARWIMTQLVATGKVSRGAMGIDLHSDLKHEKAIALGLDRPRGAWVLAVRQPSPASEAGIVDGDVIIRFNGVQVTDLNHLINMVSMTPIGKTAEVVLWRNRKELVTRVRIADQESLLALAPAPGPSERPLPSGLLRRSPRPPAPGGADASALSSSAMGLDLATLDAAFARRLGLVESLRGVAVVKVDPTSPLLAYCKPHDVIGSIDGQAVRTAEEAVRVLSRHTSHSSLELGFHRLVNGAMQWRTVRVPR